MLLPGFTTPMCINPCNSMTGCESWPEQLSSPFPVQGFEIFFFLFFFFQQKEKSKSQKGLQMISEAVSSLLSFPGKGRKGQANYFILISSSAQKKKKKSFRKVWICRFLKTGFAVIKYQERRKNIFWRFLTSPIAATINFRSSSQLDSHKTSSTA